MAERWFSYTGPIYIRPVRRGICLGDLDKGDWQDWGQLEDVMGAFALPSRDGWARDGYVWVELSFRVIGEGKDG